MTIRKFLATTVVIVAMACAGSAACQAQDLLKPDETFLFAERDSINLYMDVYYPADGSEMTVDGVNKPTILYVFGGGFKVGRKDTPTFLRKSKRSSPPARNTRKRRFAVYGPRKTMRKPPCS